MRTQDRGLIARAEAKRPFSVVYDPQDPSRSRFTADVRIHWSMGLTPAVFALGGLIALILGLARLRRRRTLLTHGHVAQGVVTSIEHLSASRQKNVVYQFTTPQGPAMGHWTTQKSPAPGIGVWVLYDPAAPARSTVRNAGEKLGVDLR